MRELFQSVRSRMVFSYIAVVLVIALLFGSILYLFFSHQYSKEIRNNKQLLLKNTVNYMESSVIQKVNQVYLSLALGSPVNIDIDSLKGNHGKILDIEQLLKNQVQNYSDLIESIHIYDTKNQFMISSAHGLMLYKDAPERVDQIADWATAMKETEESSLWTQTRMVPQDAYIEQSIENNKTPLITYVRSYPFQSSGQSSKVMIAIDIKESTISQIIENMIPADYASTFIVDQQGTVISAADKTLLGTTTKENLLHSLLSTSSSDESFTHIFDHDSYVISQDQFKGNGWRIYTTTPNKNFYYKLDSLKEVSLLLGLLAVAVGIAMSSLFTVANYSPVKRILNNIKGRVDSPASLRQNEYRFIDTAINSLSSKVDSLEETLQANHKMIKHSIMLNMIHNRFTPEELTEQLQSIHVSMAYSRFRCIVIDPVSEKWKEMQPRQSQHTLYSMIQQLETAEIEGTRLLAEELQDHKMVVIICTNQPEEPLSDHIVEFIHSEARDRFGLEFALSLGGWVDHYTQIYTSYHQANALIQYSYFFPEQSAIQDLGLLDRETSSLEIPDSYLVNFEKKLQLRDVDGTANAIHELVRVIKEGKYSAEYSRIFLLKAVSIYSNCINQVRWQPADANANSLYKQFASLYNINTYSEWMVDLITEFITHVEKRSEVRSPDTISAVKAYIRDNISGDLTLDHVSEQVFISPKYLSKIFKEETGIVYSEYVTNQRMERARELIAMREFTIEQVASTVGYRTPAYFIKKFKEIHGCTPKNFMRSLTN
ncbi:YesN/AraC family two-component response regulator [Paenibacillus amylolyticus]|uniref:YesN/AraC family two-component response regulator n=1 Tax=Paenibacillus amylolyticus TaxID=1451 RepID=A0AAP5GYW7_PAEAM|nr:AraC family transcriptional regulator [Paenibacillus amylolyticus]MDR6723188.1 YesN/AraC family two-component response regulator [Paenibacillus amylolyticus]